MDIRHNAAKERFELDTPSGLALMEYRLREGTLVLTHTEVPPEVGGQGIGGLLIQAALTYATESHLKVKPLCPFVVTYLKRHPEFHGQVVESFRDRLS